MKKTAGNKEPKRPPNWDRRVAAAYLLAIGLNQEQAAESVGSKPRTLYDWRQHESWPDAQAEARRLWLVDVDELAMAAIKASLDKKSIGTALWIAERRIPELAPPKSRVEHSGAVESVHVAPDVARQRLLDKLAGGAGDTEGR